MIFPENVRTIIDMLLAAGHEAYAVGGCVRDALSGHTPPDYDIATDAFPDRIKEIFCDYRTVDIGAKHGTIAVINIRNSDPERPHKIYKTEITTFRSDGDYSDSRRPDSVTFTRDIESDLSRRDFTVNAMAYSEKKGLIDLFGGEQDLRNKVLRCVGDPEKRFTEDALRIMRALRFMSEHGFTCEPETEKALRALKERLLRIAPERIAVELDRLLLGDYAERIILKYHDIIGVIIPEILQCADFDQQNKYHVYDVLTHIAKTVSAAPKERVIRLAMFFHDIAKPACFSLVDNHGSFKGHARRSAAVAEKTMRRLRYNNAAIYKVVLLVEGHNEDLAPGNVSVKKLLNKYGYDTLIQLCEVRIADDGAKAEFVAARIKNHRAVMENAREIVESGECYSLPQLAINGDDLIEQGIKGAEIGRTLQKMLDRVIANEVINKKEFLLKGLK
jgi:tRNA nucleotidyltransferase (CCA-adding enzyme)